MSDTTDSYSQISAFTFPLPLSSNAELGLASLLSNQEFVASLIPRKMKYFIRIIIALDYITKGSKFAKKFQLDAALCVLTGQDVILQAGTGSGKTLAMILPLLVRSNCIAVTISPLKLLQNAQVAEFLKYGITSIAINENTSNSPQLWKDIKCGQYQHLIVSPEQCGPYNGHIPRFANLLEDESFRRRISFLYIDEAHFIVTAGLSNGNNEAFRPAYGRLGDLRIKLPYKVPCLALSATLPPAVIATVKESLHMQEGTTSLISLSTNRQNLCYCVSKMENSFASFKDLCFIVSLFLNQPTKKAIIFVDHKVSTSSLARYLTKFLPVSIKRQRPIRQLHSSMSTEYIKEVFEDFKRPDGYVKVLVATASASNGIDISDIELVVLYGIPETIIDFEQKAGRGGRDGSTPCLVLLIAEPWAFGEYYEDTEAEESKLTRKQLRTSREMYNFVRCRLCKRFLLKEYNNDKSHEALFFSTQFCCNCHGDDFNWRNFYQSFVLEAPPSALDFVDQNDALMASDSAQPEEELDTAENEYPAEAENIGTAVKISRVKYRPMKERKDLLLNLKIWRSIHHKLHPKLRNWPIDFLISDKNLIIISRVLPSAIHTAEDITNLLEESEEWDKLWSAKLFQVINKFNETIAAKKLETETLKRRADEVPSQIQTQGLTIIQFDPSTLSKPVTKKKKTC